MLIIEKKKMLEKYEIVSKKLNSGTSDCKGLWMTPIRQTPATYRHECDT